MRSHSDGAHARGGAKVDVGVRVGQERDDGALEELLRAEHPRLVGLLTLYVGDRRVAEQLAQDALVKLCQHWPLRVVEGDEDACTVHVLEGGELIASAEVADLPLATLCRDEASLAEVRDATPMYAEVGRASGDPREEGRRAVGLVDGGIAEVAVALDTGERLTGQTDAVSTPAEVEVRSFVVDVPAGGVAHALEARDVDGSLIYEHDLDGWIAEVPPMQHEVSPRDERAPAPTSSARPSDDLPTELPDEDPRLGAWRPAASPVDLGALSVSDTGDTWWSDSDPGALRLGGRDVVVERLGSSADLETLCMFLADELDRAHREVDTTGEPPDVVAQTVVHMVLRQEEGVAGDAVTLVVARACGLVAEDE